MNRVVVVHGQERFSKPVLLFEAEVRPRGEHAMIVGRRGPYLTKAAFGHQALVLHSVPEGAADSAGVGPAVEDGAHHFHFAGPGIAMFAYIAVEAQRSVVRSLAEALLLQEMNGKNRCVSAVPAAKRESTVSYIRERRNGGSGDGDDLGHPAEIGVAHGDRTTGMAAPLIRLEVGQVCVPGDIDTRHGLTRLGEERKDLRLVALK